MSAAYTEKLKTARTFEEYAKALTSQNSFRLSALFGLIFAIATIGTLLAGTDANPRTNEISLLLVQGGLSILCAAMIRIGVPPVPIAMMVFGVVSAVGGYTVAAAGGLDSPMFYGAYTLPSLPIMVPYRMWERILITLAVSLPFCLVYFGTHPEYLNHRLVHVPIVYVVTVFITSVAVGHWVRSMLKDRFRLIQLLADEKRALVHENLKLDAVVIEKSVEVKKLQHKARTIEFDVRKSIARDLHDDLGQLIVGAKMEIENLQERVEDKEELQHLENILSSISTSSRSAIQALRKSADGPRKGVRETIERVVAPIRERGTLEVTLDIGEERTLGSERSELVYRAVQEGLTNILKHAGAKHVAVSLHKSDARELVLSVRDDGKGFDTSQPRSGFGLTGLTERAQDLGGRFEIESSEEGTTLRMYLPEQSRLPERRPSLDEIL